MKTLLLLTLLAGCDGGPCEYNSIPGSCQITEITAADPTKMCGPDPMEVTFQFTPTDPNVTLRFSNTPQSLRVNLSGDDPSSGCLAAKGVTVGATFACHRREETKGTCTPVSHSFDSLDLSSCCP